MQLISKQITHPYICSGLGYWHVNWVAPCYFNGPRQPEVDGEATVCTASQRVEDSINNVWANGGNSLICELFTDQPKNLTDITETRGNGRQLKSMLRWLSYMMTSSNGNIFRVTGNLCGKFPGELPAQRPVTRSFDAFYDLRVNKRLSKQSWDWWFETLSRSFWRHCNELIVA